MTIPKVNSQENDSIAKKIIELVKQRENVRQDKDWQKSDQLREQIKKQGYSIDDTSTGPLVQKSLAHSTTLRTAAFGLDKKH